MLMEESVDTTYKLISRGYFYSPSNDYFFSYRHDGHFCGLRFCVRSVDKTMTGDIGLLRLNVG